ncbi:TPA: hypothetical protein N0F65_010999, partial [Lagenidium giganteum]
CHRLERSEDRTLIPLVLLNKTFAWFEESCKQIKFGNEDCECVMKLCHNMPTRGQGTKIGPERMVWTGGPFRNAEVAWPSEAELEKPLRVAHDGNWLDAMCSRFQPLVVGDCVH